MSSDPIDRAAFWADHSGPGHAIHRDVKHDTLTLDLCHCGAGFVVSRDPQFTAAQIEALAARIARLQDVDGRSPDWYAAAETAEELVRAVLKNGQ